MQETKSAMQSCWSVLVEIHSSLGQTTVPTISPESWHHVISQTLSASPSTDDTKCLISPEVCQHCHQMIALSAITTMATQVARSKKDGQLDLEETYLLPLLQHELLKCMVDLLEHCCQYLRYQSLKALASLCSLPRSMESSAQHITELCVQAVLHRSTGDAHCVEPLQLLCWLLSARAGCVHRVALSAFLLPCLPALYQHCCPPVWNSPQQGSSGALPAGKEVTAREHSHMQTVSSSDLKRTYDDALGDSLRNEVSTKSMQGVTAREHSHMQTVFSSDLKRTYDDALGDSLRNEVSTKSMQGVCELDSTTGTVKEIPEKSKCEKRIEGNQQTASNSPDHGIFYKKNDEQESNEEKVCTDGEFEKNPSNQNCTALLFECDSLDSTVVPDAHFHGESQTGIMQRDRDGVSSSVQTASCSHPHFKLHYMFLCLVQKLAKLCSSLQTDSRMAQVQVLKDTLLGQLVTDHAVLFTATPSEQTNDCLLVERKFLDVLDTLIDYVQLRTSKSMDRVYREIAVHFVHCFQAADCSWSFPCENTLIGGRPDQPPGGDHLCTDDQACMSKDELLDLKEDSSNNPVLVLLLAVVLKSCAIIFKSQAQHSRESEEVRACVSLLHTMHHKLHQTFDAGPSGEKLTAVSLSCVTWLASMCGEQDDRWTEALLCMLDIFICLQSSCAQHDDMAMLMTMLDPHPLFVQLLELTHYNASLLIDWLTSPETCFLAYFTRYLRLTAADFPSFRMAVSSLNPSGDSHSPSHDKNRDQVEIRPLKKCEGGRQTVSAEVKSSNSSSGHKHTTKLPESPVPGNGVHNLDSCAGLHEKYLSDLTGSTDHRPDAAGLVNARESSVGMALLSCYDSDGDDDNSEGSCDEGGSPGGAVDSSRDRAISVGHLENEPTHCCRYEPRPGTEGKVKPDSSMNRSANIYCPDDDCNATGEENSSINCDVTDSEKSRSACSGLSQTEPERSHGGSRSEQSCSKAPAEPQNSENARLVGAGETTTEDCENRVDRVMHLLTDVRVKLERLHRGELLVYNPAPLLHLLAKCEQQYRSQHYA